MDVKARIAKLLNLAKSPNEEEARAALLKAREMMAEYKLRPEECVQADKVKVVTMETGITCTKTKDHWAAPLSATIAEAYCCYAIRSHVKGGRTNQISFVGLDDDAEICKRIFLYAYDCCKTRADEIFRREPNVYTSAYRRSLAEAYGIGFTKGVDSAFDKQTRSKPQEWGLVLTVPQAVKDAVSGIPDGGSFRNSNSIDTRRMHYMAEGYEEGRKFDPKHRLAENVTNTLALP